MTAQTFAEAQDILAANLPGYTKRPNQMALAVQVETAIAEAKAALLQASTGTGKSMALLIPLILSGKRGVVATVNKALQNQYATTDLPFLEKYLGTEFTWAVLKGRSNYPCLARAKEITSPTPCQKDLLDRMAELTTPDAIRAKEIIDREDFPRLTEEDWKPFSMSAAECPGATNCPFADECFAERAKARAAAAQVVITNTAYLLQDLILRNATQGNVALLGEVDQIIIDEAHALPDVATSALEDTMGEGTFAKLGRDMAGYLDREGGDPEIAEGIERAGQGLWQQVAVRHAAFIEKAPSKTDPMPLTVNTLISELGPYFIALYQAIEVTREEVKATPAYDDSTKIARSRLLRRSANQMARLESYTTDPAEQTIRWAEMEQSMFRGERRERLYLRSAPVSVAPFLRAALWDRTPTILSSATLAAGTDFSYLMRSVGLDPSETMTFDAGTPFDFRRQVLLFVPDKDQPDPAKSPPAWRGYAQAVTYDLVAQSGGGALLLYTSRSAMNEAYTAMAPRFQRLGLTPMRQGDAPSGELIRLFKANGNGVLFALRTFFEGVDIQGRALRLVVLDKLPFAVPTDLVYQARGEALERQYNDKWASFTRLAIPLMTLILTQAFGRLIRHRDDRGVVAILDPRLSSKRYGKTIISALPPARLTNDPEAAFEFLRANR